MYTNSLIQNIEALKIKILQYHPIVKIKFCSLKIFQVIKGRTTNNDLILKFRIKLLLQNLFEKDSNHKCKFSFNSEDLTLRICSLLLADS